MNLLKNLKLNFCKNKTFQPDYKKLFENTIYKIENGTNEVMRYNKKDIANHIIEIIIENLNYKQAVESLMRENYVSDYALIGNIYKIIDMHYDKLTKQEDDNRIIDINTIPILLNPWNGERIIDNMIFFNEEHHFDGEKYSGNILNYYLFPMNFIICSGGNHSQFAARYKNNGKTIINYSYDYSYLYKLIKYDGNNYIDIIENKILDFEEQFTYRKEVLFYSGLLFELGRYNLK